MKKVLAMVLAVFMLVSVLCVGVSADESAPAFVADNVSVSAGGTVDVAIRTQNNPGIVGMRLAIAYDASVLTPTAMAEADFVGATFGPLTSPLSVLWVDAIHPNKTSAYAYTGYTIPLEIAERITTKKEDNMTVTLTTYSDSGCKTSIGSNSKTFKVTVPGNGETQPDVTMELVAISPLEGIYIQGQSQVQATISAEAKLGADIKSYSMTADGVKYESPYLSDTLTKSGEMEITGCAVDSRGIPGYAKQTITVLPYYIPRLTGVAVYRCTSDGVAADNGEYLKIEATRDYAPVVADGGQKNFCAIQFQYKAENAQEYSQPVTILAADAQGNSVVTEPLLNATFYKSNAYTVQIIAVDTVGQSVTVTEAIPSERVFRHKRAGGKGLGLGGYCEEDNLLDVHWNQRVRKDLKVDGELSVGDKRLVDLIYPVGSIYMSVTDSDPALLFGGTWERLKDQFLLAAGDTYAAGAIGGEATHQLTAAEMPDHQHTVRSMVQGYSGWGEMTITQHSIIHSKSGTDYYSPSTPTTLNVAYVYGGGTSSAGGGKAHNNMPPYLAVYMYKRTA